MKKETPISLRHLRRITAILFLCPISLSSIQASAASDQSDVSSASVRQEQTSGILRAEKINPTTVDVLFANQQRMTIDFYGENIFRVFQDNSGGIIRDPEAKPEAQILVDQPRRKVSGLSVDEKDGYITLTTAQVRIELNKQTGLMKVFNPLTGKCVIEEVAPVIFGPKEVTVTLKENPEEYFYGGGVQNGRFSHKGKVIAIENQNSWTDGGVASPAPFYWSTNGYGMMWYTFRKGEYDFGATEKNIVKLSHNSSYLDIFYMVNDGVVSLLNDFYQLTGNPVLLPKFGFYEGHLNAYNRDYWKEDEKGILFEDGKRYKESQKDNAPWYTPNMTIGYPSAIFKGMAADAYENRGKAKKLMTWTGYDTYISTTKTAIDGSATESNITGMTNFTDGELTLKSNRSDNSANADAYFNNAYTISGIEVKALGKGVKFDANNHSWIEGDDRSFGISNIKLVIKNTAETKLDQISFSKALQIPSVKNEYIKLSNALHTPNTDTFFGTFSLLNNLGTKKYELGSSTTITVKELQENGTYANSSNFEAEVVAYEYGTATPAAKAQGIKLKYVGDKNYTAGKTFTLQLTFAATSTGGGADMTLDGEVATKAATVEGVSVLVK